MILLRFDKKDNPKDLVKKRPRKEKLDWMGSVKVVVCKWKDKWNVLTITNMHQIEMADVANRNGKLAEKPSTVRNDNNGMAGIDRADQMFSYYSSHRKTIFFFFSFWPFPLVRGGHSVSSFSTSFCLQHLSPSHQLPAYLPLLHLKIFSLVSLFSSFPVTPFPSFFFLHTLGLSS